MLAFQIFTLFAIHFSGSTSAVIDIIGDSVFSVVKLYTLEEAHIDKDFSCVVQKGSMTATTSSSSSTSPSNTADVGRISYLEKKLQDAEDDRVLLREEVLSLSTEKEEIRSRLESLEASALEDSEKIVSLRAQIAEANSMPSQESSWNSFFGATPTNSTPSTPSRPASGAQNEKMTELEEQVATLEIDLVEARSSARLEQQELVNRCDKLTSELESTIEELQTLKLETAGLTIVAGEAEAEADLRRQTTELRFQNQLLTKQVHELESKLDIFVNADRNHDSAGSFDGETETEVELKKVCRLLEVYKDEIHDMHDSYSQQSFELFSTKEVK